MGEIAAQIASWDQFKLRPCDVDPAPLMTDPAHMPVFHFAGLRINPLTVDETVAALAARDPGAAFVTYTTPNIEHIYFRHKNPEFDLACETSLIATNDSRILHRMGRLAGLEFEFAPGAYVVDRLFHGVIRPDDALCVIGGDADLIARVKSQFGLTRVAHHIPPMGMIRNDEAVRAAIDFVVANPSRYVFIAMGPPQSEQFCQRVIADGRATGIGLCIGSSFTVLTGQSNPAPGWMEKFGLVWLYRLVKEPSRLWRRYLVRGVYGVGRCVGAVLAVRLGGRRHLA